MTKLTLQNTFLPFVLEAKFSWHSSQHLVTFALQEFTTLLSGQKLIQMMWTLSLEVFFCPRMAALQVRLKRLLHQASLLASKIVKAMQNGFGYL